MIAWAHLCPFCGWHRSAASSTMLDPRCDDCGGHLRPVRERDLDRARRDDAEVPHVPGISGDVTGVFAALITFPWLLPILGVHLGDIVFLVPLVLLAFATQRTMVAAAREPSWRWGWRAFVVAVAAAAVASVIAVVSAVWFHGIAVGAFYVGMIGSVALACGAAANAARLLSGVGWERVVDAVLLCLVAVALTVFLVVVPGIEHGDLALTAVVVIDLAAFGLAAVGAVAHGGGRRSPAAWWLVAGIGMVVVGDSFVAAAAAGDVPALSGLVAVLWAAAAYCIASAAEVGLNAPAEIARGEAAVQRRWVLVRVVLPLAAVLAYPALALWLHLGDVLPPWGVVYFAAFFLSALVLAFGRQALLLVEHQRNVVRERRLRREATERSEELEALTGLATTMTQTLEEAPIVEQALGVLASAAPGVQRRPAHGGRGRHARAQGGDRRVAHRARVGGWHLDRRRRPRGLRTRWPRGTADRSGRARTPHRAGHADAPVRSALRRPQRLAPDAAGRRDGGRRPERARLPREARAGDPGPAHGPLQPPLPLSRRSRRRSSARPATAPTPRW